MPEVTVLGDANVDIVVPYPRFSGESGELITYPVPSIVGGGTAANTAVALARLEVATEFVGTVGQDQFGQLVVDDFTQEGVGRAGLVMQPGLNTVGVFAFVDHTGERYLWGWPRHDQAFKVIDPAQVPWQTITSSQWVHSSGMPLVDDTSARSTIVNALAQASAAGITTSFDLNLRTNGGQLEAGFEAAVRQVATKVTYLLGSGPEEFALLGEADWRSNAAALASATTTVVARNGAHGSIGFTPSGSLQVAAPQVEVVDTIGAGDVFNAGFIAAILSGQTLKSALMSGNAAAAFTVAHEGARGCPTRAQLDQFLEQSSKEMNPL